MNNTPPAAADATVDTLLTAYVRALDETQDVPAFTPWRYAVLFGELVRWEFAFLALVFVAPFLELVRLCLRRFGVDMPRSPTQARLARGQAAVPQPSGRATSRPCRWCGCGC